MAANLAVIAGIRRATARATSYAPGMIGLIGQLVRVKGPVKL